MTTDLRGKCKVPSHHEIKTLASSHCLTPLTCLIFPHPFVCIPLPKSPLYHLLFCFPLLLFSHYHRFLIVPPVVCLFKKLLLKCNFGIFKLKLSSFFYAVTLSIATRWCVDMYFSGHCTLKLRCFAPYRALFLFRSLNPYTSALTFLLMGYKVFVFLCHHLDFQQMHCLMNGFV